MYLLRFDQIKYCQDVDIYIRSKGGFVLYKAGFYPKNPAEYSQREFYISRNDRNRVIHRMQDDFSRDLTTAVKKNNPKEIKRLMSGMMENALSLPEPHVLNSIKEPFTLFVDTVINYPDIIKRLLKLASDKYSTIEHSFNVAALTLNYCMESTSIEHSCFSDYAMAGLFHDIGKSAISSDLLDSPRKLSHEEYLEIQKHPAIGTELLGAAGFNNIIKQGSLEHHLRLDGSGYPTATTPTGEIGKLIGIVDTYEALTNSNRIYRTPLKPLATLELIKHDVEAGKYDEKIFQNFVRSLLDKDL
jgi:HD-GYP domain-containing protein (c-di-GMP phosphodiesterase class II)